MFDELFSDFKVCDLIHFFPQPESQSHNLKFIWASEMSNFRHLYLVNVDISQGTPCSNMLTQCEAIHYQFTSGDWEVDGSKVWLSIITTELLFTAL